MVTRIRPALNLVEKAVTVCSGRKSHSPDFVNPFIIVKTKSNAQQVFELEEISVDAVQQSLSNFPKMPDFFVLAGETSVEDPKSKTIQQFFIIKLYFAGAPAGYIYSVPFSQTEKAVTFDDIRYVGSDNNDFLEYSELEGEGSSCNAIKMDPKAPYDYRAAFLIGHMNEERLWVDVDRLVTDMYCKLAIDSTRQFELFFEISKFGNHTPTMEKSYTSFKTYFDAEIAPAYAHVRAEIQNGNAS